MAAGTMDHKRVLVVDDNLETVTVIEEALGRAGFLVSSARNGAECLSSLAAERPDLLILDVHMPVLNGLDTLQILRQSPDTEDLPVIVLSGRGGELDVRKGWAAGADVYLTKPVRISAVVAAAKWMLGLPHHGQPVPPRLVTSDL